MNSKKTPGGKNLFEARAVLLIFAAIIFIGSIISGIYADETSSMATQLELIDQFSLFMIVVAVVYSTYFNINFTAWLKNKHDIKRW